MKSITFDPFTFVWMGLAIWAAATGRISWWITIILILHTIKFKFTFNLK